MLSIPHFLDHRLIDGGKVVSPTHKSHFTSYEFFFNVSGTHFCYSMISLAAPSIDLNNTSIKERLLPFKSLPIHYSAFIDHSAISTVKVY
jgi:hypothetical protein